MLDSPFSRKSVLLLLAITSMAVMIESIGMGLTSIAAKRRSIRLQAEALQRESDKRDEISIAVAELENWLPKCLPGDPARSSNIYQQALLLHATEIGIEEIVVQPEVAKPVRNVGHRIPCRITATMTPQQLGAYLDRIYAMDLMQKVTRLDVVNVSKSQDGRSLGLKRIAIRIEAVALLAAQDRDEIKSHELTMTLEKLFQEKPLFTRDVVPAVQTLPVANSTQPTEASSQPDPLSFVRYVASFSKRGVWQAWLYDDRTKEQYTLTQGDRVAGGEHVLRVLAIGEDFVELEIDRVTARIELGQLLIAKQNPAM